MVVVATAKVQIFKQITTGKHKHPVAALLLLLPQRYKFSSKSQHVWCNCARKCVVVATAKVQIFKQITTSCEAVHVRVKLLLLPQRYKFSSKSQLVANVFTASSVVVATAKVQIFKQITTTLEVWKNTHRLLLLPQRYKFSSKSQLYRAPYAHTRVVVATAKVQIFKQITTKSYVCCRTWLLLLLPQRYKFSSKSQPESATRLIPTSCCCYRKGTNFQANHNRKGFFRFGGCVVVATAKVQIFKQITTTTVINVILFSCCCYRKGTNFQANHNCTVLSLPKVPVVVATAKVQIFKQITTGFLRSYFWLGLLLLPQRYKFSSKSQHQLVTGMKDFSCCCYRKGTNFQANHNESLFVLLCCFVVVATAKVQIFKQITTCC